MYNNTTIYKDNDIYIYLELHYIHFHTSYNIAFLEKACKVSWQLECWRQQMMGKEECFCKYLVKPWF